MSGESTDSGAPRRRRGGRARHAERARNGSLLRELPVLLVVAFVLSLLVKVLLVQAFFIPSGSMETTLHGCTGCTADRVLVTKPPYWFSDPDPGDIVVFTGPDAWTPEVQVTEPGNPVTAALGFLGRSTGLAPSGGDFVKRVIATGGQTVACCDDQGRVTVDGQPLDEPYVFEDSPLVEGPGGRFFGPVTIPAGELWVMGDHRSDSADSRVHGPISVDDVIGKASAIVYPFSRITLLDDPDIQDDTSSGPVVGDLGAGLLLGSSFLLTSRSRRRHPTGGCTAGWCGRRSDEGGPGGPAPVLDPGGRDGPGAGGDRPVTGV